MLSLSIITPTWNRAKQLPKFFEALRAMQPAPSEHLLVDNRSTDGTHELIADYARAVPWPVVHLREGDSGLYDAMNQGAVRAKGEVLYFLNDDDRADQRGLGDLLRLLERTRAQIAFGDVWREDPVTGLRQLRRHRQMNFLTLAERSICQQATLYRREAWRAVGPFDASLKFGGDYDWMLRALREMKLSAVYGAWPVAIFALGGISTQAELSKSFAEEMQEIRQRYYLPEDLQRARKFRRWWRKWPGGLSLGGLPTDLFRVRSFLRWGGAFFPDPRALLQL